MVDVQPLPFRAVDICEQAHHSVCYQVIAEVLELTPPHTLGKEITVVAVQSKAVWILALQSYYCDEKSTLITVRKQDEL